MGDTSIEWTHRPGYRGRTWNPVRGCSRISPGCGGAKGEGGCYAESIAERFAGPGLPFEGFAHPRSEGGGWTRKVSLVGDKLTDPLSWREPSCVFTNSMSDLFHEGLSNEEIAAVFGVMAATPHHRYIVLTKRAERMREWFAWVDSVRNVPGHGGGTVHPVGICAAAATAAGATVSVSELYEQRGGGPAPWPLTNLDLGVSVENQRYANERIPFLLDTPAARRIVSYEPALGPVDFAPWIGVHTGCDRCGEVAHGDHEACPSCHDASCTITLWGDDQIERWRSGERREDDGPGSKDAGPQIDQIIIGGESGGGARRSHVHWARDVVRQCREASVAAFVKQLGANVVTRNDDNFTIDGEDDYWPGDLWAGDAIEESINGFREEHQGASVRIRLRHPKGGDWSEWPDDLRVRLFPGDAWPEARDA